MILGTTQADVPAPLRVAVGSAQGWADSLQTPVAVVAADAVSGPGWRSTIGEYDIVRSEDVPSGVAVLATVTPRFFVLENPRMWWIGGGVLALTLVGGFFFFRGRR